MVLRALLILLFLSTVTMTFAAEQPTSPIVYPRERSIVGSHVNLVLDPTEVPFFQVLVGRTEYPMVDTSSGTHAYQGLELEPGLNTITVKVFAQPAEKAPVQAAAADKAQDSGKAGASEKDAKQPVLVSTWTRQVFSKIPLLTTKQPPAGFHRELFHSREHETGCAGCHNLDAPPRGAEPPKRPEDMLCSVCHRKIPMGRHIHGPAAVWNCLACHNQDASPVKYQFTTANPWKVSKTSRSVEPALFTIPADALFEPQSAVLLGGEAAAVGRKGEKAPAQPTEIARRKEQQKELFRPVLEFIKQNPENRILVESHVDSAPLPAGKGKKAKGYKNLQQLTDARAKAVAELLIGYGVTEKNRMTAAGRGNTMPAAADAPREAQTRNNRIEIVVYPPDAAVRSSKDLSVLRDRERVLVNLNYSRGAAVRGLRFAERVPSGLQYVKGTGMVGKGAREPQVKGEELVWEIGDRGAEFQESISYVVKKEAGAAVQVSPIVRLLFTADQREEAIDVDPTRPATSGQTVSAACMTCHPDIMAEPFKHGPVAAGYCTVCHDPHASKYPSWTRKRSWRLCTTCHGEKRSGGHVISGVGSRVSHPTKKKPDPARPGKRLSCTSCHSPHSAHTPELLAFDVRDKYETCRYCHPRK